jgi:hypothetical protein
MRLRTANHRVKSKYWRRPSANFYISRHTGRLHHIPREVFERIYGSPAIRALRQMDRERARWVKALGYDPRLSPPIVGVGEGDPIDLAEARASSFPMPIIDLNQSYDDAAKGYQTLELQRTRLALYETFVGGEI